MGAILGSGIWLYPIMGLVAAIRSPKFFRALRPTHLWVILLILALPLDQFQFGGTWNLRIWNLILLGAGLALGAKLLKGKSLTIGSLAPALAFMLLASLISFLNSAYPADSLRQLVKLILVSLLLYVVIVNSLDSLRAVDTAIRAWILTSCVVALWGIVQLSVWVLFQINWMTVLSYRPPAWFSEATWYGEYLAFSLALTLPFLIIRRPKDQTSGLWFALALQTFGIFLSATRTAWLAVISIAIAIVALIWVTRRIFHGPSAPLIYRSLQALSLMAIVLLLGFVVTSYLIPLTSAFSVTIGSSAYIQSRFNLNDPSVMGRADSTRLTLIAALQHPIIGNGIGTWGRAFMGQFEGAVYLGGSHFNIFVGPFYDAGLLGLAAMLLLLGSYGFLIYKMFNYCRSNVWSSAIAWACLLSFIATLVISQLNPWYLTGYAWVGFALGVAAWNGMRKDSVAEAVTQSDGR